MAEKADPAEFMSSYEEIHSVFYGIGDGIFPFKAGTPYPSEVLEEPHYYLFGQIVGKILFIIIIMGVSYLIFI